MQSAETVLSIIRERGSKGLPLECCLAGVAVRLRLAAAVDGVSLRKLPGAQSVAYHLVSAPQPPGYGAPDSAQHGKRSMP